MPRLPGVSPKKFISVIQKLDFQYSHTRGSHNYYTKEKQIVCVAMHGRDIPKGTLMAMIKDIGLSRDGFINLL